MSISSSHASIRCHWGTVWVRSMENFYLRIGFCIAVGTNSPLARQQTISLADLVQECWIMTPIDSPGAEALVRAFRDENLSPPEFSISTFSVFLRNRLTSSGRHVTALPASVLRLNADTLFELPITLPMPRWHVGIVTLKDRALNPAVH